MRWFSSKTLAKCGACGRLVQACGGDTFFVAKVAFVSCDSLGRKVLLEAMDSLPPLPSEPHTSTGNSEAQGASPQLGQILPETYQSFVLLLTQRMHLVLPVTVVEASASYGRLEVCCVHAISAWTT
jgi:hypothetical protein